MQNARRLKKKVDLLSAIVKNLKQKEMILLESSFLSMPLEVMRRIMNQKGSKITRKAYPPALRSFALTLQFYSKSL